MAKMVMNLLDMIECSKCGGSVGHTYTHATAMQGEYPVTIALHALMCNSCGHREPMGTYEGSCKNLGVTPIK